MFEPTKSQAMTATLRRTGLDPPPPTPVWWHTGARDNHHHPPWCEGGRQVDLQRSPTLRSHPCTPTAWDPKQSRPHTHPRRPDDRIQGVRTTSHGVCASCMDGSCAESPPASEQCSAPRASCYRPWGTPTQPGHPPHCCLACLPVQAALLAWSSAAALCVATAPHHLYQPQNSQRARCC